MEWKYSSIVDPSTYTTQGLCDGISLRCHQNPDLAEIGALRCHEDWRRLVGPLGLYRGFLGPRWHFAALAFPECIPERLELIGYVCELMCLYDDMSEVVPLGGKGDDKHASTARPSGTAGNLFEATTGKNSMLVDIARKMLAIDNGRATVTLSAWAEIMDAGTGHEHGARFHSEMEYMEYREKDFGGEMLWRGLIAFGLGITIPDHEIEISRQLATTALVASVLINDLYSYEREYESAMALDQKHVVNLVWVLMQEHSITEEEAKDRCRQKIKERVAEYQQIVAESNKRINLSSETKRYVEALLYWISGGLVWSIDCPRYHKDSSYTERQLELVRTHLARNDGEPHSDIGSSPLPVQTHDIPTNGLATLRASNGDKQGSDRMKEVGIVNIFATKEFNPARATKVVDPPTYVDSDPCPTLASTKGHLTSTPQTNGTHASGTRKDNLTDGDDDNADRQIVQAPYEYIISLPSKRVRDKAIDALNIWLQVPPTRLEEIKLVSSFLHNSSLMLDDMQDGSQLRRGHPSTHAVFGIPQTVNSANFQFILALEQMHKFQDAESLFIFIEELKSLHIGQGLDLYWTSNMICPSVPEYLKMVDGKTGGLFRLFARLIVHHATNKVEIDLIGLCNDLGQYYQIRDDYQNLVSEEYTDLKGFCEDLDEGKFSLPFIHVMQSRPDDQVLRNLWVQRRISGGLNLAQKKTILAKMRESGSLEFTANTVRDLQARIESRIGELEAQTGILNSELRSMMGILAI